MSIGLSVRNAVVGFYEIAFISMSVRLRRRDVPQDGIFRAIRTKEFKRAQPRLSRDPSRLFSLIFIRPFDSEGFSAVGPSRTLSSSAAARVEALTSRLVENLRSSIGDLVHEIVSASNVVDGGGGGDGPDPPKTSSAPGGGGARPMTTPAVDGQKPHGADEDIRKAEVAALDVALKELKWCHKQV